MKHTTYIPDCPKCATELQKHKRFVGPVTDKHPFGTKPVAWWVCPACGWRTNAVPEDDFGTLTEKLTAELRAEDEWSES